MRARHHASPFAAPSEAEPSRRTLGARSTQFSLGSLLLVLTVMAATMTPLAYLMRGLRGDRPSLLIFILLALAAPTLSLTVVSLAAQLLRQVRGPHR